MTKIINIRNESDIAIDTEDIKMTKNYYENFMPVNFRTQMK